MPFRGAAPAAMLVAVLALTWLVYQPGLRGGFLLDDFSTLSKLSERGDLRTFQDVERFVFGGITGPTGRPIALASFLLDDNGWPSQPERFKRTNLFLHLICGLLIAWLARVCLEALRWPPQPAAWATTLAAAIWLLHPLLVSTTLYAVQRMTILAALFVLCGLISHVRLRLALATTQRPITLMIAMTAQLALFTLLAFFSKENGALLPILALVLEATILAEVGMGPNPRLFHSWRAIVLGLPALLIVGYLGYTALHYSPSVEAYRGFTIGQRLLSEARVLVTYLYKVCVPRVESGGLYHDDFIRSADWLTPPTTALSAGVLVCASFFAWERRHVAPLLSCAILFFLAGHLLESTTVPLELYFEHRNYLPTIFLAIAGGAGLAGIGASGWRIAASAGVIAIIAALTWQRAVLWGDPDTMLLVWSDKQTGSKRTQLAASQVDLKHGAPEIALRKLDQGLSAHPDSLPLLAQKLSVRCAMGRSDREDLERMVHAIRFAPYGPMTYSAVELLFESPNTQNCIGSPPAWQRVADALRDNATVNLSATGIQEAYFFEGLAALRGGSSADAAAAFTRALQARYEYSAGMRMVVELASAGAPRCAMTLLDAVELSDKVAQESPGLLEHFIDAGQTISEHQHEFTQLRQQLQDDLADAHGASSQCGNR